MKITLGIIALLITASSTMAQKAKKKPLVLKDQTDSISYAIGVLIGSDLKAGGFDKINYEMMSVAMDQCLKGDSLKISKEDANLVIQTFAMAEMKRKADENEKVVKVYMDKNKLEKGVVTTESGLQYRIEKEGTGPKPTQDQKVKVHYTGKFINGEVFDSSVERGEPATFGVTQVIKGWTEALQLMPVGSKWTLFVPPSLAYGETGNARIPGNSILLFEVELLGIEL